MAKVKYGSTVAQLSGSIGGVVYARNRGGAYIRNKTAPVQPNSVLQSESKTLFAAAVNTWTNVLAASEREGWNSYAASVSYTDVFGDTRYYSGQQRYVQCFIALTNSGGNATLAATAPTIMTEAENVLSSSMAMEQGAAVADDTAVLPAVTAPLDVDVGDILLVHFGTTITQATNYFKGPYRFAAKATYATGKAFPDVTITDPYMRTLSSGTVVPIFWRVLKKDNRISSTARKIVTLGAYSA